MSTNPIDLTTVNTVKAIISKDGGASSNTSDDSNIQSAITAFSNYFLQVTGQSNGATSTHSPFAEVVAYNEWYNGNGNDQMFLKHYPIVSVTSVTAYGAVIQESGSATTPGWVIDQDQKSLVLRGSSGIGLRIPVGVGPYAAYGYSACHGFPRGKMNINVIYTAGYAATPPDIAQCAAIVVAQNYKRFSQQLDKASQTIGAVGGTIKFRDWEMPPDCMRIVRSYTRTSFA